MGCTICKQLKTEHYEEKAGDCWFCMGVNIAIATVIVGAAIWFGVPAEAGLFAWGLMLFRIGRVGYLFPDTPRWLPYVDFIFKPIGYAPSENEMLAEFAEEVADLCNDHYDDEERQSRCANDLAEIVLAYGHGHLDEEEYLINLADRLDVSAEEVERQLAKDGATAAD